MREHCREDLQRFEFLFSSRDFHDRGSDRPDFRELSQAPINICDLKNDPAIVDYLSNIYHDTYHYQS